ncbi:phosphotransferase [Streptomyces sp. CAU 1734]|uniref:phosphotransferase n=1 Tax=Streptomyces sp. CAU 1734 TaxID=3140360 RepID=UPI003261B25D
MHQDAQHETGVPFGGTGADGSRTGRWADGHRPPAGSEPWARTVLAERWGMEPDRTGPALLAPGAAPPGRAVVSWRVEYGGTARVLRVRPSQESLRAPYFHLLRGEIGAHCRRHGVPVAAVLPALDGSTAVRRDGALCELSPWYGGEPADPADPARAAAVAACGLRLRDAPDSLPAGVRDRLASVDPPLPPEEENWRAALTDARHRPPPPAESSDDDWSRMAAAALRALVAAGPLSHETLRGNRTALLDPSVIHSDLHARHFLLAPAAGPEPGAGRAAPYIPGGSTGTIASGTLETGPSVPGPAAAPPPVPYDRSRLARRARRGRGSPRQPAAAHPVPPPTPPAPAPGTGGRRTVVAVLGFDELHTGDRLLDIARLAEAAGYAADPAERHRSLAGFLRAAYRTGQLRPGEEALLMPVLPAHSLPAVVDIARDILGRGRPGPRSPERLALLSPARGPDVHRALGAAADRSL